MTITRNITAEQEFLNELRKPDANQPLQVIAEGRFPNKQYPLDYAYGLTIGGGLARCECGLWGNVEDLTEGGEPIPCPHKGIVGLK